MGINDLRKKSEIKKTERPVETNTSKERPTTPFNIDDLRMKWRQFAFIAKEKNLTTLYTSMTIRDPMLLENYTVHYTVENSVQMEFIESQQVEIVDFLRKELKNWSVHLKLEIGQAKDANKLFTSQDKYKNMVERNPNLETFRKRFRLDLDL